MNPRFIAFLALLAATAGIAVARAADQPAFAGRVVDRETGAPLAGVPVLVGAAFYGGASLPSRLPADVEATTTDDDGTFAFACAPRSGAIYVEILPSDGHFPLHAQTARAARDGTYRLSRPTPQEAAWLERLNAERAARGARPLVFDELVEETARYRAREMAESGDYAHRDAFAYYRSIGGVYPPGRSSAAENIAAIWAPSTWEQAQDEFMLERCNWEHTCPAGPVWDGETGHYQAIVDGRALWAGIARVPAGKPPVPVTHLVDYYAQLFVNGP